MSLAQYLGTESEAWRAARTLTERLRGIKPGAVGDRAEFCVSKIEETLGFAAGRYFVKEAFPGASKEKGTKVITGLYCKAFRPAHINFVFVRFQILWPHSKVLLSI